ncbi:hypothetical protein [Novosphingobium pokkalii]|uniref:Uncharacterized protein n=1 Tax=Novosphingobium pokkalii TaxID=1770194 RepID=A0ABV7UXN0_9SPHN|nr:hypothetical protein [Novosphingobium pokkalii]GHC96201.1 hypothetical protein GCM10019060_25990 [Novosphingobium pokkalii]
MDEDALFAVGTVLAALGGLLERKGVCTTHELAETLGGVACMTQEAGDEYKARAAYIGSWAHMVRAAALGAGKAGAPPSK